MNTKFLPIGTVVSLKGANKKLMITGFCMYNKKNNNQMYDYCGCLFPEGIINTEKISLFNHEQIERIYYLGLQNDEEIIFNLLVLLKIEIQTIQIKHQHNNN